MKKLFNELITTFLVFLVGLYVLDIIDYNRRLKYSYWDAFLNHPILYIKNNGTKQR